MRVNPQLVGSKSNQAKSKFRDAVFNTKADVKM